LLSQKLAGSLPVITVLYRIIFINYSIPYISFNYRIIIIITDKFISGGKIRFVKRNRISRQCYLRQVIYNKEMGQKINNSSSTDTGDNAGTTSKRKRKDKEENKEEEKEGEKENKKKNNMDDRPH
jgi:hypothetical protein